MDMGKAILLLALPVLILAGPALELRDDMPVVTQEMVDKINAAGSWKASLNWAKGMTTGEAKKMLGSKRVSENKFPVFKLNALEQYLRLPMNFTWQGNKCLGAIRNQGICGACWALGVSETFSDRVCIHFNSSSSVPLSPQWLVSCDKTNWGCDGGDIGLAWTYIYNYGIPEDYLFPYVSGQDNNSRTGNCSASGLTFYTSAYPSLYIGADSIMFGLMNGPIDTYFEVYSDFYSYESGIYVQTTGKSLGYHNVKIVGWGNLNGTYYWIVANSWGTDWGLQGFFNIQFGQCGIDRYAMAGDYYSQYIHQ